MSAVPVHLVGNVVADPELTAMASGTACVRFRVATNERYRDGQGEWAERDAVLWTCEAWGEAAATIAATFAKSSPVVVVGVVRSHDWITDEGERRSRMFVKVDAAGVNVMPGGYKKSTTLMDGVLDPVVAGAWAAWRDSRAAGPDGS